MSQIVKFRVLDLDGRKLSASCAVRIPLKRDLQNFFSIILPPSTGKPPVFFCDVTESTVNQLRATDFESMPSRKILHLLGVRGLKPGINDKADILVQMRERSWQGEDESQVRQYLWRDDENMFETPFYSVQVVPVHLPADISSRPSAKLLGVTMASESNATFLLLEGNNIREVTIDMDSSHCLDRSTESKSTDTGWNGPKAPVTNSLPLLRDIAWKEDLFPVKEIRKAVFIDKRLHCIHATGEQVTTYELKTFDRDTLANGGSAYRDTGNRLLPMGYPLRYSTFLLERLQMEAPHYSDHLVKSEKILSQMAGIPTVFCRAGENDFALLEWMSDESIGRIHRLRFGQESTRPLSFSFNEKPTAMEWLEQCGVYLVSLHGKVILINPTSPGILYDISSCFAESTGGNIENFCLAFHGPRAYQNNLLFIGRATRIEAWRLENVF